MLGLETDTVQAVLLQVSTIDPNPLLEGYAFVMQCFLFALIVLALGVLGIINNKFKGEK